ncbi:MAG: Rieske 2Fe-2S domain-containing protein [Anaerolineae bacterium]|nr:Rieske 2Fe-2S domain-containing protein [Anaerolineae bacterium]
MTTSPTVAKAQTAASKKQEQQAVAPQAAKIPGISRREFLYYAWGGSISLLTAQTAGLLIWFGLPRFGEGEFGGTFLLTTLPLPGSPPLDNPQGKFWLSVTEGGGIVALYKVCTHLGCLFRWVDANHRFECPCHGSKFELNGRFIEGPAPRSLDRFAIEVVTTSGVIASNADGDPVVLDDLSQFREVRVDTGTRIQRSGKV